MSWQMFCLKFHQLDIIIAIMRPYNPIASAKIRVKIIPTKTWSVWAYALTPASPATPIANPEASAENQQQIPAAKILNPLSPVKSVSH